MKNWMTIKRHLVTKAIIPDSLYVILTVCAAKEISSKVFPQKAVVLFVLHRITIMLYCLQAGKISSQAKKDANREKPVMDEELGSTAPLTADSDGRDGEPLGDTVGFDK